jgi:D-ribose pyranase
MKKGTLLNSDLSYAIASLGHTQTLTIGDAGLPVSLNVEKIDLAVTQGVPSFIEVLDAVLSEFCVEEIILADEIVEASPELHSKILERFPETKLVYVQHEEFKLLSDQSIAVVRTGETTPYANIILRSGVTF